MPACAGGKRSVGIASLTIPGSCSPGRIDCCLVHPREPRGILVCLARRVLIVDESRVSALACARRQAGMRVVRSLLSRRPPPLPWSALSSRAESARRGGTTGCCVVRLFGECRVECGPASRRRSHSRADMKLSVLAMILFGACLLAAPVRAEHALVFYERGLERIVDLPGRGELLEAGWPQPATLASVRRGAATTRR